MIEARAIQETGNNNKSDREVNASIFNAMRSHVKSFCASQRIDRFKTKIERADFDQEFRRKIHTHVALDTERDHSWFADIPRGAFVFSDLDGVWLDTPPERMHRHI